MGKIFGFGSGSGFGSSLVLDFSILEALFPKKLASNFGFLTFELHFRLDPGGPNPDPECIKVPVPKAKSCGSCVLVQVPQH